MGYRRLIPCIFVKEQKAVAWFDNSEVIEDDVLALAKRYSENGADEIIWFDLSESEEEHEEAIDLLRHVCRAIHIPVSAGGHIERLEDVKKILYAGAKRAILNLSKNNAPNMMNEASGRFGNDKIVVSLNDLDALFKHRRLIEKTCDGILFMHRLDLNSISNITNLPAIVLTDTMEDEEIFKILKAEGILGVSGRYISQPDMSFTDFKEKCAKEEIKMMQFESAMDFSQFKLNSDGLLPVVVQDYKTAEVLMLAYMNRQAFEHTLKTGRMTYFSRSRQELWIKGDTSGHYQYVKSLMIDCDKDTLLAKVDQIGAACHTGNPTCFFQTVAGADYNGKNPLRIFDTVYETILDRKKNPKEGSYTNYLFEKGIDKILKKLGEEATEIVIAAKNPNPEEIKYEMADFLYHAMVLMVERGVSWEDIINELADR